MHDIGLIYLVRDVEFSGEKMDVLVQFFVSIFTSRFSFFRIDRISPICLPLFGGLFYRRFVGHNPFLAGWGILEEKNLQMSPVLMQVQVPIIRNDLCLELYRRIKKVRMDEQFDDRVLCTGYVNGGKDSCRGDSGGPVMVPLWSENGTFPFYQIGIVSWGKGCAQPNRPGVSTNIQYYAEWIHDNLALTFD